MPAYTFHFTTLCFVTVADLSAYIRKKKKVFSSQVLEDSAVKSCVSVEMHFPMYIFFLKYFYNLSILIFFVFIVISGQCWDCSKAGFSEM